MDALQYTFRALLLLLLLSSATWLSYGHRGLSNSCRTPLGDMGMCVSLSHCPEVLELYKQLPMRQFTLYSTNLKNLCGNRITYDQYPVLCCTSPRYDMNVNQLPIATITTTTTTSTPTTTTATVDVGADGGNDDIKALLNNISALSCIDPVDGNAGICKPLTECTVLYERAKNNPTDSEYRKQLLRSNAICDSVGTNVCCPLATSTRTQGGATTIQLPSEDEGCGLTRQPTVKIVGGADSNPGAWPWMALIGYDPHSLTPFRCGGALITSRHVLTAAHCLLRDLSFVRLGEYDIAEQQNPERIDVDVARAVGHPHFGKDRSRLYDIAILYLVKNVEFTDYICPVCLPVSSHLRTKSFVNAYPYVAGWGRTMEGGSAANILQELQIRIMENSECNRTYGTSKHLYAPNQFNELVLCAGDLGGGRDTCRGDSGGPLMVPEAYKGVTHYYALGIVSYGIGCGRVGVPSVYTNTQHFIDWITERVAET